MLPLPLFAFIACTNGSFPCAGVETLAFRTMRVGLIYAPRTCTRVDFVLRSYAGQSVLDVREYAYASSGYSCGRLDGHELAPATWSLTGTQTYVGASGPDMQLTRTQATGASGIYGQHARLVCIPQSISVLDAGAKSVGGGGCEGPPRVSWRPSAIHHVDTLSCAITSDSGVGPASIELHASPGVEWVHENSDCVFQEGAYRAVAP